MTTYITVLLAIWAIGYGLGYQLRQIRSAFYAA